MNLTIKAFCAVALVMSAATSAFAGQVRDRVYADSFGNLVIHSPGGYKRIIVGMGHAAEGYNATGSYYETDETDEPDVVYLEEGRTVERVRHCYRPTYRWQGRSYMYGLPDHVVPQAPLVCD